MSAGKETANASAEKATGSVRAEKEYGTYDAPWTKTFDLAFLFMWIYALIGLTVYTIWYDNKGAVDREFFAFGLTKIVTVGIISLIGGLICRKFCDTDEKGYIIYTRPTKFKVNYLNKRSTRVRGKQNPRAF